MFELKISPKAREDLAETRRYVREELDNTTAADSLILGILEKIRILSQYPEVGIPLNKAVDIVTDYRFLVYKGYLIFYRHEHQTVFVLRVLSGKRDYIRILFSGNREEAGNSDNGL